MTIKEAIALGADYLSKKEVPSPRLQVELLLAHLLKMPRMNLYLNFDRALAAPESDALRELIKRRGRREPLQHITGTQSFCGLEITVNSSVLIPRPETEELAERAWKFLAGRPAPRALDLCTGSGCLALALAAHAPEAMIDATDISPEALSLARENAGRHPAGARVAFHQGDGFAAVPRGAVYDLIVSNPPYIPSADIAGLEPEVRDHEPRLALDGGPDGMDFYRRIAAGAAPYLKPDGCLILELNDSGGAETRRLFDSAGWTTDAALKDLSGRERIFVARRGAQFHDDARV